MEVAFYSAEIVTTDGAPLNSGTAVNTRVYIYNIIVCNIIYIYIICLYYTRYLCPMCFVLAQVIIRR